MIPCTRVTFAAIMGVLMLSPFPRARNSFLPVVSVYLFSPPQGSSLATAFLLQRRGLMLIAWHCMAHLNSTDSLSKWAKCLA